MSKETVFMFTSEQFEEFKFSCDARDFKEAREKLIDYLSYLSSLEIHNLGLISGGYYEGQEKQTDYPVGSIIRDVSLRRRLRKQKIGG